MGGGISGLSAAWFFRQRKGPDARILVLENHDDFGGHAKRNEFSYGGRTYIGYGGSQSIHGPGRYSAEARGLLQALSVHVDRFYEAFDQPFYSRLGMSEGDFFTSDAFDRDVLLARGEKTWAQYVEGFPLSSEDRRALVALGSTPPPELAGMAPGALEELLEGTSYQDYLGSVLDAPDAVVRYLADKPRHFFGIGSDGISARTAMEHGLGTGYPGFVGVDIGGASYEEEPYIFHFPDGNASIARLLVRSLIPGSAPGGSMEDIVTASFDYGRLDDEDSPARLRLKSTVIHARNTDSGVSVTYVSEGAARSVTADACVLACWNGVIPYLCPELPEAQRQALAYCVKVPLVYVQVLVRNFEPWAASGLHRAYCPGSFFSEVELDFPVSLGAHSFARGPEDPVLIHMVRVPGARGLPPADQFRVGRAEIEGTTFEDFEREIRSQLDRMVGPHGFEPREDIVGITVNRWPHGYAYWYGYLGEPEWTDETRPCVVGRQPFGRIAIANTDAAGDAYAHLAIDQAHRAISELLQV